MVWILYSARISIADSERTWEPEQDILSRQEYRLEELLTETLQSKLITYCFNNLLLALTGFDPVVR